MTRAPVLTALALILLPPLSAAAAEFFTLEGHGGPIKGIDVAPSGEAILTASFDYSIGLWSGPDAAPRWLEGHNAAVNAAIFVDAARAVSGGDDFELRLWDIAAGRSTVLGRHQGKVNHLALSPDGRWVASASWDGTIGLWPLGDGSPQILRGHDGAVNATAFAPDGTLFSVSADGTLRHWTLGETPSDRLIVNHGFGINTLVLGTTRGWLAYGAVDGGTRVIDAATGAELADLTADRRPILAMDVSPDLTRLAVGDGEGYIMVVDTADWSIERDFRAATRGPIWALHYSGDGQGIHAAGIDDALFSWPAGDPGGGAALASDEQSFLRDPATMGNGERQFMRKCSICHELTGDGARRAGPSLEGLFGRRVGALEGYAYSAALKGLGFVWDEGTIDDLFELGPEHFVPGSKMPMQRIAAQSDRDDLIAFLRKATLPQEDKQ
ncbi:c-type cytochrome [Halovulum dunhuangense]|uniref:C-type cytochrome n=1 Tax=Halovulum dunhuangense TaxID=1505036 RepID=A0A849L250_9RHOB|nr:c-type cytochrome [Halovulum dunhuangense]NNU80386.1 c-type cytochrome [Halovulum dunhuangense]